MKILVLLLSLLVCDVAIASSRVPKDVAVFARNADACEHYAGEFDGGLSEKRQREIEKSTVKYCGLAQKQLKQLAEKYKHDPEIIKVIRQHENDSVISFR